VRDNLSRFRLSNQGRSAAEDPIGEAVLPAPYPPTASRPLAMFGPVRVAAGSGRWGKIRTMLGRP